jgi:hypothetical protein
VAGRAARPRNAALERARLRVPSPTGSGWALTTQELAEAVNGYIYAEFGRKAFLDASDIRKLERGAVRFPRAHVRAGLRAVLGAADDAEIGLFNDRSRRPVVADPQDAAGTALGPKSRAPSASRPSAVAAAAATAPGVPPGSPAESAGPVPPGAPPVLCVTVSAGATITFGFPDQVSTLPVQVLLTVAPGPSVCDSGAFVAPVYSLAERRAQTS